MRNLLFLFLMLGLAASAAGQTVKSLGYATNGQVIYSATNRMSFTNITPSKVEFAGIVAHAPIEFSNNSAAITRTNLGASTLGNALFVAANTIAARQALGLQTYTTTLTNSVNDVELGSTVANVTVGWDISPTNATYAVRTIVGAGQTSAVTNNSSTLARTGLALTSNTTWTLTVGDGLGVTNTATTSVNFWNYLIVGRSTNDSLSSTQLRDLHTSGGGAFRNFAANRNRSFSMDGGGQYIYIAYPTSFGNAMVGSVTNAMIVGGGTFNNFVVTTNTFTNSQNFTNSYIIYRTLNIINGTGLSFVIQ